MCLRPAWHEPLTLGRGSGLPWWQGGGKVVERRARAQRRAREKAQSAGATWPRTETFAATVRHGALSGGCFGPPNSPEAGPTGTRASTTELSPPLCPVLHTVLRCHKLALHVSHQHLGLPTTLLRPAAPAWAPFKLHIPLLLILEVPDPFRDLANTQTHPGK